MSDRTYLTTGRVNQKWRTRVLLLEVAAELIRGGRNLSISEVADIAKVSRATAYRYFPTVDLLIAHAALWKVAGQEHNEFDVRFLNGSNPYEKVDAVVVELDRLTKDHQNEFRAMLRVSLEQGSDEEELRGRIRYFAFKKALEGLHRTIGRAAFDQLVCALSLTVGIESQIVLRDICKLQAAKALEVKRWAAKSLLHVALSEANVATAKKKTARSRTLR